MAEAPSKKRKVAGRVVTGLLVTLFIVSASAKLLGPEEVVAQFEEFGLSDMRVVIGVGEALCALLYLIPVTASLGVLLLSAHMGGAIVLHMSHGQPYYVQSAVLILVWIGYCLRYPEMLVSFSRRK